MGHPKLVTSVNASFENLGFELDLTPLLPLLQHPPTPKPTPSSLPMPAPTKRPASASSSSANKKAKVVSKGPVKPTVKEESKRKVPVTASSSKHALDIEEAEADDEQWKGDEVSDFSDDEDDEDVEVDGEDEDEVMADGEGADGAPAEPKTPKDPEGEHRRTLHTLAHAMRPSAQSDHIPRLARSCPTCPSGAEDGPTRPPEREAKLGDPARVKVALGPAQQEGRVDIQEGQGGSARSADEPARGQDGCRRQQARRRKSRPECEFSLSELQEREALSQKRGSC